MSRRRARRAPRIVALAFEGDEQVEPVLAKLRELGAETTAIDLSRFPATPRLSILPGEILHDGVDLLSCGALWLRQVGYMWPMPSRQPSRAEWGRSYDEFARWMSHEREITSLKYSLVSILADVLPVVNPVSSFAFHQMKPLMYATLEAHGVPVPTWVAGNDAEALDALLAGARGGPRRPRAVVKPLAGGAEVVAAAPHPVELDQVPRLFQRFASGRNVRTYVVGDRVVASGLIQVGEAVDWRVDSPGATPFKLPASVARLAVKGARALGMHFAALDLVLTSDGPQFLDVNPTPMFQGFEQLTGLDVTTPVAEELLALASRS